MWYNKLEMGKLHKKIILLQLLHYHHCLIFNDCAPIKEK